MSRCWWATTLVAAAFAAGCAEPISTDATGGAGATDTAAAAVEPTTPQTFDTLPPGAAGPVAAGEFVLTGAVERTGTYEVLYPVTDERLNRCERISGEEATGFAPPTPTISGDARLAWVLGVREYAGPGTYDLTALGAVSLDLAETAEAEPERFTSGATSSASLDVDGANNGNFEFAGLTNADGEELSGSFTWNCRNSG